MLSPLRELRRQVSKASADTWAGWRRVTTNWQPVGVGRRYTGIGQVPATGSTSSSVSAPARASGRRRSLRRPVGAVSSHWPKGSGCTACSSGMAQGSHCWASLIKSRARAGGQAMSMVCTVAAGAGPAQDQPATGDKERWKGELLHISTQISPPVFRQNRLVAQTHLQPVQPVLLARERRR